MIRIIGLIKQSETNGVAFQEMTFIINKSSNKNGEFFQIVTMRFLTS